MRNWTRTLTGLLFALSWVACGGSSGSNGDGPTGPPSSPPTLPEGVFSHTSPAGSYAIYLPPGTSTFRGIYFVGPGGMEDTRLVADRSFDSVGDFDDPDFQAFRTRGLALAAQYGLAIMGATLPPFATTELDLQLDNFQAALDEFADQSRHAELSTAPLALEGYSNGGCFVYAVTRRFPERVVGFWVWKSSCLHTGDAGAAKQVPGMLVFGEADARSSCLNLTTVFESNRPAGALWALAVQPGAGHERVVDFDLVFGWMDAILQRRLPPPGSPVVLPPIEESSGWLGDLETATIAGYADYQQDRNLAGWLPTADVAQQWSEFVHPGTPPECPPFEGPGEEM